MPIKARVSVNIGFNAFKAMGESARRWGEELASDAAGEVQAEARDRVHIISGRLWRSIQVEPGADGYTVEATAPYAAIEEFRPGHAYFFPAVEAVRRRMAERARAGLPGALSDAGGSRPARAGQSRGRR